MLFLLSLNRVWIKLFERIDSRNDSDVLSLQARAYILGPFNVYRCWLAARFTWRVTVCRVFDYPPVVGCLSLPLKVSSSRLAALLRHRLSLPKCCPGRQLTTFWNTTRVLKGRRIRAHLKMASPKTVPKDAQVNNALETVLSPCCATFILFKP